VVWHDVGGVRLDTVADPKIQFERADMKDTKLGQADKDDPAQFAPATRRRWPWVGSFPTR
jgi:hypothetical protein